MPQTVRHPKRVLHFTPYFPPHAGGLEMYVQEWSLQYVHRGGSVCIVTLSANQPNQNIREENGVHIIVLPAYDIIPGFPVPLFFLPSFWRGLAEAKKWSANIIHTHTRFFLSSFLGGLFAKITKTPWIHIEHGSGFVVSGNTLVEYTSRLYDNTLGKWTLRYADAVVTVSKMCEAFVREIFGIKNPRTIYRGILPVETSVSRDDQHIYIGYVGRLVDLKGVDILIRSFAQFLTNYTGTKKVILHIVGDGKERVALEKLAASLGRQDDIVFLGKKDIFAVRQTLLPSFHIFVNPSFQEGLPTTVIEALVAGCRVIATDVGGTREIAEKCPFTLIPPHDIDALAHALASNIMHAHSPVQKPDTTFFSWDETFEKFSSLYQKI